LALALALEVKALALALALTPLALALALALEFVALTPSLHVLSQSQCINQGMQGSGVGQCYTDSWKVMCTF